MADIPSLEPLYSLGTDGVAQSPLISPIDFAGLVGNATASQGKGPANGFALLQPPPGTSFREPQVAVCALFPCLRTYTGFRVEDSELKVGTVEESPWLPDESSVAKLGNWRVILEDISKRSADKTTPTIVNITAGFTLAKRSVDELLETDQYVFNFNSSRIFRSDEYQHPNETFAFNMGIHHEFRKAFGHIMSCNHTAAPLPDDNIPDDSLLRCAILTAALSRTGSASALASRIASYFTWSILALSDPVYETYSNGNVLTTEYFLNVNWYMMILPFVSIFLGGVLLCISMYTKSGVPLWGGSRLALLAHKLVVFDEDMKRDIGDAGDPEELIETAERLEARLVAREEGYEFVEVKVIPKPKEEGDQV